jgi:geranylgeranyl pyrophosphate synthase
LPIEPRLLAESLSVVSASHLSLATGQGADLMLGNDLRSVAVDQLLKIFTQKTGEAVKVALLLGAINGGAPADELKRLETFSDWFGIAYQIRDDLNEFREEDSLEQIHHFPFLLALLNERFAENGHQERWPELEKMDAVQLRQVIIDEQIDRHADRFLKLYVDKCYQELDQLQNLKLKLSLYGVMGKIF